MQRLFTKKLPGYQGLNYPARLEKAGLCTLELRRLRAELYFCYKILHGLIATPLDKFFTLDRSGLTRGHSLKLKPIIPRLDIRLYFFSYRVVNVWNSLSPSTVEAASFNSFGALLNSECLDSFLILKNWQSHWVCITFNDFIIWRYTRCLQDHYTVDYTRRCVQTVKNRSTYEAQRVCRTRCLSFGF